MLDHIKKYKIAYSAAVLMLLLVMVWGGINAPAGFGNG